MASFMSEELAAAAFGLFQEAAENLFEDSQIKAIESLVCEGIRAFSLGALDPQVSTVLQKALQTEILHGYGVMARLWLWDYEIECRRLVTISMIDIALGNACPFQAGLCHFDAFSETCDRYARVALEIAERSSCNICSLMVARVVETAWITCACEIAGRPLPAGDEPESDQFAICIASIFTELEALIRELQERFE